MRKLPLPGQIYLVAVALTGLICLYRINSQFFNEYQTTPIAVALLAGLAILAGAKKITIPTHFINSEGTSMSLGFGVVLAAMVSCGPGTAVVASILACLSGCVYPKRQRVHQIIFNVALASVEAFVGGTVYQQFHSSAVQTNSSFFFVLVTGSALCYYLVNTFGVSVILGLCEKESPLTIWRESFIWSAPAYLATATITALATLVLRGSNAGLLLFLLPVVYLFFQIGSSYQKRNLEHEEHEREIKKSQDHLADLYLSTIKSLALAIDAKDQYTHQHIIRVQRYSVAIAKELGLTGAELEAVNTGALLHDIGKIGVPEYVLMKPGRLTPDEFDKIKKHPEIGAAILDPVEFPWPVLPVVRSHHEKWDGSGYPDRLKGEDIPLTARIMAVADVYDALTSTRSYRTAWTHEKAVGVIKKDAGTHFDPLVVEGFLRVIDGVVTEMAREGEGPLAPKVVQDFESMDKTAQAADQIARTSTELYVLYEVVRSLNERLGVDDLASSICKKLCEIYPESLFVVLLHSGNGQGLAAKAAQGLNADFFRAATTIPSGSITSQTLLEGKTYWNSYNQDDLLLTAVEGVPWSPLQCQIVVPLTFEGQELGTLNCYHGVVDGFSKQDLSLMEVVAHQASEVIYKSLLMSRLQSEDQTDQLTQTGTLRSLSAIVESEYRSKDSLENGGFLLLCIDIDGFRAINDIFGHRKGDELLKDLADLLKACFSNATRIARYGSDEFLVMLPQASASLRSDIELRIERAVSAYETHLWHVNVGRVRLSVTIGSAVLSEGGTNFASAFLVAESDLKRKKALKRLTSKTAESLGIGSEAA